MLYLGQMSRLLTKLRGLSTCSYTRSCIYHRSNSYFIHLDKVFLQLYGEFLITKYTHGTFAHVNEILLSLEIKLIVKNIIDFSRSKIK